MDKKFKILSIDGGGIRGIFPIVFLANIEAERKAQGLEDWQTYKHFDLICGTSTGGIIALGLALGIPAQEIADLYLRNADLIFSKKKPLIRQLFRSAYSRANLESLIQQKFREANGGVDPRLIDCKTNVCIPIYDLMEGRPSVLKSKYHPAFVRDYHIPAYQAAIATSAAPTYFDPYSSSYIDLNGVERPFQNKVDGGVFANNPTLNGIVEVQKAFDKNLEDLAVLSLGTGHQKFCDAGIGERWSLLKRVLNLRLRQPTCRVDYGFFYWIVKGRRKRLIELFMQGQTQQVQNLISLLNVGIDRREQPKFVYHRIDTELDETCNIDMDETNIVKLSKLSEKASIAYQNNATVIRYAFYT